MGFDFKDIATWGLAGLPKQVFESKQFAKHADMIGKAIPNEFSKYGGYGQNIPYLGWLLSGVSAMDQAATAYADTDSASKMWEAGSAGTFGQNRDPGQYSATGQRGNWTSQEAFRGMIGNQISGIGNFAGRIFGGNNNNSYGKYTNALGSVTDSIGNMFQPNVEANDAWIYENYPDYYNEYYRPQNKEDYYV